MAPCHVMTSSAQAAASPADYKKVLKPLLERRRRARINRCLDQMRDLMVEALSMEGDSAAKLEKADVLELAVAHLHKLRTQARGTPAAAAAAAAAARTAAAAASPQAEMDRYRAGFSAAATVVSRALAFTPGVDVQLGTRIMHHLGSSFRALDERRLTAPLSVQVPPPRAASVPSTCSTEAMAAASPAESCSSGYSSGADSGLLTLAGGIGARATPPSPAALTPASPAYQCSPMNLKLGDEGMWRPW